MSSTGSGSDQPHLLALLRAIRLRIAAPEASEAGAADAAAALAAEDLARTAAADADAPEGDGEPVNPEELLHPRWPSAPLPSVHPLKEVTGRQIPRAQPGEAHTTANAPADPAASRSGAADRYPDTAGQRPDPARRDPAARPDAGGAASDPGGRYPGTGGHHPDPAGRPAEPAGPRASVGPFSRPSRFPSGDPAPQPGPAPTAPGSAGPGSGPGSGAGGSGGGPPARTGSGGSPSAGSVPGAAGSDSYTPATPLPVPGDYRPDELLPSAAELLPDPATGATTRRNSSGTYPVPNDPGPSRARTAGAQSGAGGPLVFPASDPSGPRGGFPVGPFTAGLPAGSVSPAGLAGTGTGEAADPPVTDSAQPGAPSRGHTPPGAATPPSARVVPPAAGPASPPADAAGAPAAGPPRPGFSRLTGFPILIGPADPAHPTPRGTVTPVPPTPQEPPAAGAPEVPAKPADRPPVPPRPAPTYGRQPGGPPGLTALTPVGSLSPIDNIPGGPVIPYISNPMPGEPLEPIPAAPPPVREENAAGMALPGDGMNPADAAARLETQRLLSNSLSLAGGPAEVAARLRAAVLQAQPQLLEALPGSPVVQRDQLAAALTWLVHNLDDPPLLAAGCAQLGAALAECGVQPQQLHLIGAALAEAMRAGMAGGLLRQDFDLAWRETWQRANEWMAHGAATTGYQPTRWTAVVVSHDLRRHDLAVVRLRPYLPMPFRPGQYARIEVSALPGTWRPYSLAGSPRRDNIVELHVRAKTTTGVSGTLVHHTRVGDHVRLARVEGAMGLPEPGRDLLLIAGDTGVAPLKALLAELAATGDPRSAVLFWGARNLDELYDIDEITQIARACKRATVIPVISEGNPGPYASGLVTDAVAAYGEWSDHEVYLAGPPLMLAATSAALQQLGVDPARIHHDSPEG